MYKGISFLRRLNCFTNCGFDPAFSHISGGRIGSYILKHQWNAAISGVGGWQPTGTDQQCTREEGEEIVT